MGESELLVQGNKLTYNKGSLSAEGAGKTQLTGAKLTLTEGSKNSCWTSEKEKGVFASDALNARLGYLSKSTKEVGLQFVPATEPFAACEVAFGFYELPEWDFSGALTGKITPVNTKTKKFTLQIERKGEANEYLYFEGEKESAEVFQFKLKAASAGVSTRAFTFETEKETEIKA